MRKEEGCSSSASAIDSSEIEIQSRRSKISKNDRSWLSVIKEKSKPSNTFPKIQKVPPIIRQANHDKCYDPLVVSIGPYHHGKSELQFMENHKYKMAWKYANNDEEMLEILYTNVMDVAKDARECYKDDNEHTVAKFTDDEFTHMMFLDGCFVLQLIYCFSNQDKFNDLEMKNNIAACVKRDLLLLENQLPFQILKELMSSRSRDWRKSFNDFHQHIGGPPHKVSKKVSGEKTQAHHQDQLIWQFETEPAHLLEYFREQLIGENNYANRKTEGGWSSYRSAKELKAIGIYLKPSKTYQFRDVSFQYNIFTGQLSLPPMTIDCSTKSLLLNMVAYEALPDSPDDFGVTSYICFLDSLIDRAEDVEVLRSKGILLNFLGSDEQVAEVFNQIADNVVPNPYTYADVRVRIEKHSKNKIKRWLAMNFGRRNLQALGLGLFTRFLVPYLPPS